MHMRYAGAKFNIAKFITTSNQGLTSSISINTMLVGLASLHAKHTASETNIATVESFISDLSSTLNFCKTMKRRWAGVHVTALNYMEMVVSNLRNMNTLTCIENFNKL